jgi:hypothetical protein
LAGGDVPHLAPEMVRDLQQTVCILDAVAQHMEAVAKR